MRQALIVAMLVCVSVFSISSQAAVHIFLKFDGIDGDSTAVGHEKWSDVDSYQFESRTMAGPGIVVGPFDLIKQPDRSSPLVFQNLVTQRVIDNATVDVINDAPGPQPKLEFSFRDVVIFDQKFDENKNGPLLEEVSFNFSKATMSYFPIGKDGKFLPPVTGTFGQVGAVPEPATWLFLALAPLVVLAQRWLRTNR